MSAPQNTPDATGKPNGEARRPHERMRRSNEKRFGAPAQVASRSLASSKKYRGENPERARRAAVICVRENAAYTRHLGPPESHIRAGHLV
jgi:hypothetical protein